MKLFAQHGSQEGEKINEGFGRGLLDGVIFSPRDISLETLKGKLNNLATNYPSAERLIDPQYYAIFLNGTEEARLGYLLEDYDGYFQGKAARPIRAGKSDSAGFANRFEISGGLKRNWPDCSKHSDSELAQLN